MSTIPITATLVNDLMETNAERELWQVVREHERPPYFFPDEGVGNRLNRAARVVTEGRITPNSDGSYGVEGSAGRHYLVTDSCSCPQSQKGKSKWCYHAVAVALYVEWRKRCAPAPVVLGTLRAGTAPMPTSTDDDEPIGNGFPIDDETLPLPLPPATVDERLAQMPVEAPRSHEEPTMPADESSYLPEPDTAPVTVLERPAPKAVVTRSREAQTDDLEAALATWSAERAIVQRFLKEQLTPGIDFYTLQFGGRESKPSLSKAGAEKVTGWLKLQASFVPDIGTWEMLGKPTDQVFYICTLRTRNGEIVGEGRGARSLKMDKGDINKAIKMAEKSSFVSAVLRTGALSDVFTQDLEDLKDDREEPAPTPPARTPSADLRQQIWAHIKQQAPDVTGREEAARWVKERTGYALVESNFAAILHALEVG